LHYILYTKNFSLRIRDNCKYFRSTDCRPVQMWMLAAHGTRCPTIQEIDKIVSLTNLKEQILKNHEERRGKSIFSSFYVFVIFFTPPI